MTDEPQKDSSNFNEKGLQPIGLLKLGFGLMAASFAIAFFASKTIIGLAIWLWIASGLFFVGGLVLVVVSIVMLAYIGYNVNDNAKRNGTNRW